MTLPWPVIEPGTVGGLRPADEFSSVALSKEDEVNAKEVR
jgi:hypothetical protein